MNIRRLCPADAGAYQSFRLSALHDSPAAFGASFDEEKDYSPSAIEERLALKSDVGAFGAFNDVDTIIGSVALARENSNKLSHKAFIWGVYVAPDYRGQGVSRLLLIEALSLARSVADLRQVNLGVNAENAIAIAIKLYKSLGFVTFGCVPHVAERMRQHQSHQLKEKNPAEFLRV